MNEIPIVLAFTPNYVIPAVTTIQSILTNSSNESKFEIICLLTEKLSRNIISELENWCTERLKFKFILLDNVLQGVYINERFTAAASFRLLLPNILPYYKKVIYLDCDIIVRNSLSTLYNEIELKDNYLGAVYEATLNFQANYVNKLGLKDGKYFNSGVLLMNLEMMRKDEIVSDLIEMSNNPDSQFPDQDALNIVCQEKVLGLSPIYNSIRTFFIPQYKTEFLRKYNLKDWHNVQQYGTIHYTGAKPWNSFTIKFEEWWKYYFKLPKAIQKELKIKKKIYYLGIITNTKAGRIILESFIKSYRFLKYK